MQFKGAVVGVRFYDGDEVGWKGGGHGFYTVNAVLGSSFRGARRPKTEIIKNRTQKPALYKFFDIVTIPVANERVNPKSSFIEDYRTR